MNTVVITSDQFLYSWSNENTNQLNLIATPADKFEKLACGGKHVLLLNEKGQVFSFGSKCNQGQLGSFKSIQNMLIV
jgi:alpha-tubulin suppressor-like RCC1 family protein